MTATAEITPESFQSQLAERDAKILYLEEQIAWLKRQIFGKKSERAVDLKRKERILQSDRLHIDESPVDIFDSPKLSQGYMWVLVGGVGADPPYRLYDFYEKSEA